MVFEAGRLDRGRQPKDRQAGSFQFSSIAGVEQPAVVSQKEVTKTEYSL